LIHGVDDPRLASALDAIYDAAVSPQGWPRALEHLASLFDSHFADVFARTHDRSQFHGRAIGLDRADYEDEFLGIWCTRNVWGKTKPVRVAGEVMATWQMVSRTDLLKSEIYNEYLSPRDLHEGLRLALWSGGGWIQDISLLRSWSAGPFDEPELALGRMLLPHLQRAASVSRRLHAVGGFPAIDAADRPAFLVDRQGLILRANAAAEALLINGDVVTARHDQLGAAEPAGENLLADAIASAGGISNAFPQARTVTLQRRGKAGCVRFDVVPLREDAPGLPGPRAVLVMAINPPAPETLSAGGLMARFGLTPTEAELAIELLSGAPLLEIAASGGRSIHTIRTHLSRVLQKTQTRRQSDLMRLLLGSPPAKAGRSPLRLD
jgi:DNA-binding CsgD family transcriptional regulator